MSGVGFWELILVFLIGLIVLGPERLPRVASQLGTWLGQARRMTRVMKRQLEEELNLERDLSIRPRPSALPPPVTPKRKQEFDDTYSPAHDADSAGTGVSAPGDTDARRDTVAAENGSTDVQRKNGDAPAQHETT
ncbi:MAG: Sec-independent protein translocase protein TatB [Woeseiaceae bacterium]